MRSVLRLAAAIALGALPLAGCSDQSDKTAETPASEETAEPAPEPGLVLARVAFADLPGWTRDNVAAALPALARSCEKLSAQPADRDVGTDDVALTAGDFAEACAELPPPETTDADTARRYFTRNFVPFATTNRADGSAKGLFTGYFEAELTGARQRSETYDTPIYATPDDLVIADLGRFDSGLDGRRLVGRVKDGRFVPYPTRGDIQNGHLAGRGLELLWLDDALDVFLLHVQGSGRVVLPNGEPPGEVVRVGFAAHNGRDYRSIGRELIERGELEPHNASWPDIRAWIEAHPEAADQLFAENPRFIFFRKLERDGPVGAQGVALTPRRSLAVDRAHVPLGLPIWLDTVMPGHSGEGDADADVPALQTLLVAQDTGGAIEGPIRGDFFWGYGEKALAEAGKMKSHGRYFLLLPEPAAARVAAPGA